MKSQPFTLARDHYLAPPVRENRAGEPRRLGIEVEFAGLTLERAAEVVAGALGADVRIDETKRQAYIESQWGPFRLELDAAQLRDKRYLEMLEGLGIPAGSATSDFIDDTVQSVALQIVPMEVVAPPVPWSELSALDPIWKALREAGAQGTRTSPLRAFGLHLNPEVAREDVGYATAILQSYLLLEDWLLQNLDVDPSRQIAPFIRPFPEAYRREVLTRGYCPDWDRFAGDYAEHNPTRNRRLDLWPLIRHVTGDRHAAKVREWDLVNPRPTFHYRLPNCEITRADWTPAEACNGWVMVERLSRASETRFELAQAYLETSNLPLRMQTLFWVDEVERRLHRLSQAGDDDAA